MSQGGGIGGIPPQQPISYLVTYELFETLMYSTVPPKHSNPRSSMVGGKVGRWIGLNTARRGWETPAVWLETTGKNDMIDNVIGLHILFPRRFFLGLTKAIVRIGMMILAIRRLCDQVWSMARRKSMKNPCVQGFVWFVALCFLFAASAYRSSHFPLRWTVPVSLKGRNFLPHFAG